MQQVHEEMMLSMTCRDHRRAHYRREQSKVGYIAENILEFGTPLLRSKLKNEQTVTHSGLRKMEKETEEDSLERPVGPFQQVMEQRRQDR